MDIEKIVEKNNQYKTKKFKLYAVAYFMMLITGILLGKEPISGCILLVGVAIYCAFIVNIEKKMEKIREELKRTYHKLSFKDRTANFFTEDIVLLEGPTTEFERVVIIAIFDDGIIKTKSISAEEKKNIFE